MFERYREIQKRRESGEASESGFTLIELLIVIVVLGILAAIVIFSLTGVSGQSKAAACTSDAKSVEIAADAYQAKNNTYPAELSASSCPATCTRYLVTTNGYTIGLDTTTHVGHVQRRSGTAADVQRHDGLHRLSRNRELVIERKRPALSGRALSTFTFEQQSRTERGRAPVTYNDRFDPWLQMLWDKRGSDLLLTDRLEAKSQGGRRSAAARERGGADRTRRSRISSTACCRRNRSDPRRAPRRRLLPDLERQGPAARERVLPEGAAWRWPSA